MKLNMLKQRGYLVLEVTESMTVQEARVLQAGLEKIFKSTKDVLILDLTLARPDKDAFKLVQDYQLTAFKVNNDLFIVGPDPKVAQFPTRKEAVQLIVSGASISGIREKILGYLSRHLERQVIELEARQEALVQKYVVTEGLPMENDRLSVLYRAMLEQGEQILGLKNSTEPAPRRDGVLSAVEKRLMSIVKQGNFQISELFNTAKPSTLIAGLPGQGKLGE